MILVLLALAAPAGAADAFVDVPFTPPAEVAFPVGAAVVAAKGKVDADDCDGAAAAALAEAAEAGTVVRVVVSEKNLTQAGKLQCRQRVAGDFIASSVVTLTAVVIAPGTGPAFAPVSPDRAVQVTTLLAALADGDLARVSLDDIDGQAWVDLGGVVHPEVVHSGQLDENGRAVKMYEEYVPSWVSRWASVLGSMPEVAGAILTVEVESENPSIKKSKQRELYRFAVPTAIAGAFLAGRITDDQFLASCRVHRAGSAKKPEFLPFQLDVIEGGLAVEGDHGEVDRAGLDVDETDMEGLDDEITQGEGETWERK